MGLLNPHNSLFNSIIVYIILISLIIYKKPHFIYDKKIKKFKQFGMQHGRSILSLPLLSILIAVITYVVFFYIEQNARIVQSYNKIIMNK